MGVTEYFVSIVRAIVGMPKSVGEPPIYDRMALYRCTVTACADDGSKCDVTPENKNVSPEKNVPIKVGIPGASAVVSDDAIVLLGWEGGDPAKPYVVPAWESATVTKLVLAAQAMELAGNTSKAILDTVLSDLATALGYIPTGASSTYPGLLPNVALWTAFLTKLTNGTYQSTKVKHG